MFESSAGMRRGAETAHFTNAERAHDRATIGRAATYNFDIGRATAECLKFGAEGEDWIKIGCKDLCRF